MFPPPTAIPVGVGFVRAVNMPWRYAMNAFRHQYSLPGSIHLTTHPKYETHPNLSTGSGTEPEPPGALIDALTGLRIT